MTVSPAISPWSAVASIVASGIVLTVSGATSSSTYIVSGRLGSLTDVDAHSGRCLWAPAASSAVQRSDAKTSSYASVGQPGVGDRGLAPQRLRLVASPIASSRLSTSVSMRLTKNDATERIVDEVDARWPCACSRPVEVGVHDRAVAVEAEDQRDVDADALGGRGGDRGRPSWVAGILIITFGRSTSHQSARASAIVASVLCASRGSTSMLTRPSCPSVRS